MAEYSIQTRVEKRGRKRVFWGRIKFHCHKGEKRVWSQEGEGVEGGWGGKN